MYSRFLRLLLLAYSIEAYPAVLRICSDPNNMPFSNQKLNGFENRIAEMLGRDMNAKVEYFWWAQRRGFIRNTLQAGLCDVIMAVPSGSDATLTSAPYYRSTYVFVTRKRDRLRIQSFNDPLLRRLKIGVQLVGDDYANTPPAHALSRRGIVRNVSGYRVLGDYSLESPPSEIVKAVAAKEIDIAIVWGPLAGYFIQHSSVPLQLAPVSPQLDDPALPFTFEISMGVRRNDIALKRKLDRFLVRRRTEIADVLRTYGVPLLEAK